METASYSEIQVPQLLVRMSRDELVLCGRYAVPAEAPVIGLLFVGGEQGGCDALDYGYGFAFEAVGDVRLGGGRDGNVVVARGGVGICEGGGVGEF